MKVAYHDPCNQGRSGSFIEEPRYLLRNSVMDYVDLDPCGRDNWCCGGGGGALTMNGDLRWSVAGPSTLNLDDGSLTFTNDPAANNRKVRNLTLNGANTPTITTTIPTDLTIEPLTSINAPSITAGTQLDVVTSITASGAAVTAQDEEVAVGFVPPALTSPFHVSMAEGASNAGEELGWTVDVQAPTGEAVMAATSPVSRSSRLICQPVMAERPPPPPP